MEKIFYEKSKFVREEHEFEIEDMKNVFLKGRDSSFNRTVYLGIWQNQNGGGVTATIGDREIKFDYSRYGLSESTANIRKFLESNRKVEKISKDLFFEKLDNIKNLLSK
jgi:hypothetical protein